MSSIGSSNNYGPSVPADLAHPASSNPPGGPQIESTIYKDDSEAVTGLRSFYLSNHSQIGKRQSFRFENSTVKYAAHIMAVISMYYQQRTALELSMDEGKETDFTRLKNFAKQLYSDETPIARLQVGFCLTASGGKMINCSEQFIPPQQRGMSSNLFGFGSGISFSSISNSSPYFTTKNKTSTTERLILRSIPSQTTRTISGETFESHYRIGDDHISLKATGCTFKGEVQVQDDITLTDVTATNGEIRSENSSITAKNSALKRLQSPKGTIIWSNETAQPQAGRIDAAGLITLTGVNARYVDSKKGTIYATNSQLRNCSSVGSIQLTNTKAESVVLIVPKAPKCVITLDNAEIDELTIKELPETQEDAMQDGHSVTGYPPSFNYPNGALRGHLSRDASGRIEGKPYQLVNGEYKPGIHLIIRGTGKIGKVNFINCTAQSKAIDETIICPSQTD